MAWYRRLPRWLMAVGGGAGYAAAWWAALGILALPLRSRRDDTSEGGDGLGAVVPGLMAVLFALWVAHFLWTRWFRWAAGRSGAKVVIVTLFLYPAVIVGSLIAAASFGLAAFIGATVAIPIAATALLVSAPQPAAH